MSDLMNIISQALGEQQISQISSELGENPAATKSAVDQALPLLIGSLASNKGASNGWSMLSSFLDSNHDGSIMDDLIGMAFGSGAKPAGLGGEQALQNILGTKQSAVEQHLETNTALSASSVAKLLPMLAPLVVGALAKMQQTNSLDQTGVDNLLKVEREKVATANPQSQDLFSSLLDRDGDGSVSDDLAGLGTSLLGKLMG